MPAQPPAPGPTVAPGEVPRGRAGGAAPGAAEGSAPRPRAVLRIVSGPGAGQERPLTPGRHTVGAAPSSWLQLDDPVLPALAVTLVVDASGRVLVEPAPAAHAARTDLPARLRRLPGPALLGGAQGREVDLDGPPPLVHLARRELRRRGAWEPGQQLAVGDVLLELAPAAPPPPAEGSPEVVRVTREAPAPRAARFVLPASPLGSRWSRQGRGETARYREAVREVEARARLALGAEAAQRTDDLPDPVRLLASVTSRDARLWQRRRGDDDWLVLRVGTADVTSDVSMMAPDRGRVVRRWSVPDVPVALDLDRAGVVGLAGPAPQRRRLAAWLLAQVAVHHSPGEVRLSLLSDPGDDAWAWARRLPHVREAAGGEGPPDAGGPEAELGRLVELMRARQAQARAVPDELTFDPVLVVIDAPALLTPLPPTLSLIKEGPAVGFRFLWLDAEASALPRECGTTVVLAPPVLQVRIAGAPVAELVRPDLPVAAWFSGLADAMEGLREAAADDELVLPTQARLLELIGMTAPTGQAVLHRWVAAGGRTTTATIGEGPDGPFRVDLRRDGPHVLVAGEWGAGKSELLQTLIASLAVGNRPDELAFVLVDYQGDAGAGAFADCARLPHTVGVVTDLDTHETARVLESLAAELQRRQTLLAGAAVKDLDEYHAARDAALLTEGRAGRLAPGHRLAETIPRLVLVIDEFAALAADLPGFLAGLVEIAQVGRARGIHLVLATERPSGVLSEEVAGGARLRIALRVASAEDSLALVQAPDAARIPRSLPGRAYARACDGPLVGFQAARVAGTAPGATPGTGPGTAPGTAGRSDLALLVDAVRDAASAAALRGAKAPWTPALPDVVLVDDLPDRPLAGTPHPRPRTARRIGAERRTRPGTVPPLRFGLADVPAWQHQDVAVFDVARAGHLLVAGAPGSGRTTVLRALAAALARDVAPEQVRVWVVDPRGRLTGMTALPHLERHLGAGHAADEREELAAQLLREIAERRAVLGTTTLADARERRGRGTETPTWPYLLVVVDDWEQAFGSPAGLSQRWQRVLAEGGDAGVAVVLAGVSAGASSPIAPLIGELLLLTGATDAAPGIPVLDLAVEGAAGLAHPAPIGRAVRTVPPGRATDDGTAEEPAAVGAPGRGAGAGDRRRPVPSRRPLPAHEVQVALLVPDPTPQAQDAALADRAQEAARRHAGRR
ncbi:MAG: FtsK/SpoIIIE domain-containing protein [Kineosporiaceae bacterium]